MITIILDTNFLVYCAENKIDYKSEIDELVNEGHTLVVFNPTIEELIKISENAEKSSDRNAAKLALKLLEHNRIVIEKSPGNYADTAILDFVKNTKAEVIIATLDSALRKKLKTSRKIVIVGKRKLAFE
jgi:rRNA-processing protein FCF1